MNEEKAPIKLDASHPTVARIMSQQGSLSDEVFAKQYLTCSGSSWGRIKSGDYHAQNTAPMLSKLEKDLAAMEDKIAAAGPGGISDEILPLRIVRLGLEAVKQAWAETRDRLVVVLAPTGGGKSTLSRAVERLYGDRVVICEASETWRNSYIAAIHGVLASAGEKELPHSARLSEEKLITILRERPRIIIIDEAHYFGPTTINLVKLILNRTKCTVLILAIPKLWDRMKLKAWEESKQIRSRTCDLSRHESVDVEDVKTYFQHHLNGKWDPLSPSEKDALATSVATAANQFGQLNTVSRICRELEFESKASRETINSAIKTVKALQS